MPRRKLLNNFCKEGELANNYIEEHNITIDYVKASGSLALVSAYLFGLIEEKGKEIMQGIRKGEGYEKTYNYGVCDFYSFF